MKTKLVLTLTAAFIWLTMDHATARRGVVRNIGGTAGGGNK